MHLATSERVGFGSGRFCLIGLRGEISSGDSHRLFHLATVFRVANKTGHNAVEYLLVIDTTREASHCSNDSTSCCVNYRNRISFP
jgi:hypothetical protein